ncbi:MAG: hypothetical protein KUG71_02310 [Porticoccaceae bacterium]|nr:hypothetical protein [Porticoccaceae bacterium]
MKRPSLFEGIAVALIAGITAAIVFPLLAIALAPGFVLRLLVAGVSLVYFIYLLRRSQQKLGRLTVLGTWALFTTATWLLAPSVISYAAIHLLMIWLVRSLYFYSSVLSALADLGLTGLALIAALWAWFSTGSLFLTFWCLFLVQALFVLIPRCFARLEQHPSVAGLKPADDPFETAHRAAEQAIRKLASSQ